MKTDCELLKLAAKAAGIEIKCVIGDTFWMPDGITWNPLTDDGDALRLAVMLNFYLRPMAFLHTPSHEVVVGVADWKGVAEKANGDPYAATRRAIVRAAAEIGSQS